MAPNKKLTIIVPAFNEEKTVARVLKQVLALPIVKEVIAIDDGSKDKTWQAMQSVSPNESLKLLRHEKNQGKGSAIRTALSHATGDALAICDADGELDPNEIPPLAELLGQSEIQVVFGTRHAQGKTAHTIYYWGDTMLTVIFNFLYGQRLTDLYNGYKIFSKQALTGIDLKSRGFEFEAEVAAKVSKKGYRIHERPVSYKPRTVAEGKKINWKDAFRGLRAILKYRFQD